MVAQGGKPPRPERPRPPRRQKWSEERREASYGILLVARPGLCVTADGAGREVSSPGPWLSTEGKEEEATRRLARNTPTVTPATNAAMKGSIRRPSWWLEPRPGQSHPFQLPGWQGRPRLHPRLRQHPPPKRTDSRNDAGRECWHTCYDTRARRHAARRRGREGGSEDKWRDRWTSRTPCVVDGAAGAA